MELTNIGNNFDVIFDAMLDRLNSNPNRNVSWDRGDFLIAAEYVIITSDRSYNGCDDYEFQIINMFQRPLRSALRQRTN